MPASKTRTPRGFKKALAVGRPPNIVKFFTQQRMKKVIDAIETFIGLALFAAKCVGILDSEWPAVRYAWALIAAVARLFLRWWPK